MLKRMLPALAASLLLPQLDLLAEDTSIAGIPESETALATNDCGPAGDLHGDAGRGQPLHQEHCAECHGYDGKAEVIIMHMDEPPPDQSDPEYMGQLPDAYLYLAICRGGEGIGKSIVMRDGPLGLDRDCDLISGIF